MTVMSAEKSAPAFYKGRVRKLIALARTEKPLQLVGYILPRLENNSTPSNFLSVLQSIIPIVRREFEDDDCP